jgi:hypothetical protein
LTRMFAPMIAPPTMTSRSAHGLLQRCRHAEAIRSGSGRNGIDAPAPVEALSIQLTISALEKGLATA